MFGWLAKGRRINRATYWTICAAALVLSLFLHRVSIVFSIWILAASMKRCRDFGWPGWAPWALAGVDLALVIAIIVTVGRVGTEHHGEYIDGSSGLAAAGGAMIALGIVLIGNVIFNIVVGCIPGDTGANKYGPPPLPGIGKGVDDYTALARVFGDGSESDFHRSRQAYPDRVKRSSSGIPHHPVRVAPSASAETQRPVGAGFGRKGL